MGFFCGDLGGTLCPWYGGQRRRQEGKVKDGWSNKRHLSGGVMLENTEVNGMC